MNLKGQLLIAMPGMEDSRFARSVVLVCSNSEEGSMGFVLNQPVAAPTFVDILQELKMDDQVDQIQQSDKTVPIYGGGPVEQGRGFVVHTMDYCSSASARVGDLCAVSATLDALKALASPKPPVNYLMFLGYAGWSAGQLEEEIAQNGWLTVSATPDLLFETHHTMQYDAALAALGISEATLSGKAGHA